MSINVGDQLELAQQIATGMEYVASRGLVHADLACRNCLVDEDGDVKVADFGLARYLRDKDHVVFNEKDDVPMRWMAPECFNSKPGGRLEFSLKTDVWVSWQTTLALAVGAARYFFFCGFGTLCTDKFARVGLFPIALSQAFGVTFWELLMYGAEPYV